MVRYCIECDTIVGENKYKLYGKWNPGIYHKTCIRHTPECSSCGQDSGYFKHKNITQEECSLCMSISCRSCGYCLQCPLCGTVACKNCIFETINDTICKHLKSLVEEVEAQASNDGTDDSTVNSDESSDY